MCSYYYYSLRRRFIVTYKRLWIHKSTIRTGVRMASHTSVNCMGSCLSINSVYEFQLMRCSMARSGCQLWVDNAARARCYTHTHAHRHTYTINLTLSLQLTIILTLMLSQTLTLRVKVFTMCGAKAEKSKSQPHKLTVRLFFVNVTGQLWPIHKITFEWSVIASAPF